MSRSCFTEFHGSIRLYENQDRLERLLDDEGSNEAKVSRRRNGRPSQNKRRKFMPKKINFLPKNCKNAKFVRLHQIPF